MADRIDHLMNVFQKKEEDIFEESYINLSPKEKANTDMKAAKALKKMFDWDKQSNPELVKDLNFETYIEQINPELVLQRVNMKKSAKFDEDGNIKKGAYLGTRKDVLNRLWGQDFVKDLKSVLKKYGNNVTSLKKSVGGLGKIQEYFESGEAVSDGELQKKEILFGKKYSEGVETSGEPTKLMEDIIMDRFKKE